jgi:hypothetical protein
MLYAPHELGLELLKNVPKGNVGYLVGRKDIGLVVRLEDNESAPQILMLEGPLPFTVADWTIEDCTMRVVCRADDLRVKLVQPDERGTSDSLGAITVHLDGAFISATMGTHRSSRKKVSLRNWGRPQRNVTDGYSETHTAWELGKANKLGHFDPIFKREPKPE